MMDHPLEEMFVKEENFYSLNSNVKPTEVFIKSEYIDCTESDFVDSASASCAILSDFDLKTEENYGNSETTGTNTVRLYSCIRKKMITSNVKIECKNDMHYEDNDPLDVSTEIGPVNCLNTCPKNSNENSKSFSQDNPLIKVKHTQEGKQEYSCSLCKKTFEFKYFIERHVLLHTTNQPFTCDICGKSFSNLYKFDRHVHSNDKRYGCVFCEKQFSHYPSLIRHKRIHTGERPYKCDVCENNYIDSTALKTHRLSHTGLKPFSCDLCSKSYTRKFDLVKHKKSRHKQYHND